MLLKAIVNGVNMRLAGERLSYYDMLPFLDSVIDDINTQLNACFPAFSELPVNTAQYDCFPDKWIRMVLMPGAAHYFYMMDEEGAAVPGSVQQVYLQNLFYMLRDYLPELPRKYTASEKQGTAEFALYGYPVGYIPSQYVEPVEEAENPDEEVIVLQILIGNTIKLPYGSEMSVVNRGTPEKPILDFALAEGPPGQTGPTGAPGPQGATGLPGATGPAGAAGTYRTIKNIVLNVEGWAVATPSQLIALDPAPNDAVPTHAYVMDSPTVLADHSALLFGPDSETALFRKCVTAASRITFFTVGAPTANIIIDMVVLF